MADYGIMAAPPGTDHDAGSDSTIRPTVDAAEAAAFAYAAEQESNTLHVGTVLGDALPLGPAPDEDATILMPLPGVPIGPPDQGGSYDGSNIGGRG